MLRFTINDEDKNKIKWENHKVSYTNNDEVSDRDDKVLGISKGIGKKSTEAKGRCGGICGVAKKDCHPTESGF